MTVPNVSGGTPIDPTTWGNAVANDVNFLLSQSADALAQSVRMFADAGIRAAVIPTPNEGMMSYLQDVNRLEIFNGAAWVEVARTGGGLSPVTVSIVQSIPVSATVVGGQSRQGTWCEGWLRMSFTSNGFTGAGIIANTSLPLVVGGAPGGAMKIGSFMYQDPGTGFYEGATWMTSGGQLDFYVHGSPYQKLGQFPNFAIIAGDAIDVNFRYPTVL
jgi:hypothetical protein